MIFAEVSIETLAGGGVTGMLVLVMVQFMRRTKDTDERRDEVSRMLTDAAMEREARALGERDRAMAERDTARAETERFRALLDEERRRNEEDQRWMQREIDDLKRKAGP